MYYRALLFALALIVLSSHARATPEAPPPLPSDTIQPSASIGYLGGISSVSHTGEFHWSLPLAVLPGRSGFQPSLSIRYQSNGANGWLGVGFGIDGLSEIHRCGQSIAIEGQTRGVDFSYSDRFCMDGQRLILISGEYGHSGSEYRTERSGFDKIVYWEGNAFESSAFDVWTKDGRILRYASFGVERAVPMPDVPYALQAIDFVYPLWVLKEEKDRAGNRIQYNYSVLAPPPGEDFVLEYLLDNIVYGDPNAPKRKVQFIYEDRWDPSFTWVSGVRFQHTKRLQQIEMHAPNPDAAGLVQRYEFTYLNSVSTQRTLLHTIRRCDGMGACLWGKDFQWENAWRPEFESVSLPELEFPPIHFQAQDDTGFLIFDATGDGRDDLLYRLGQNYFLRTFDIYNTPLGARIELDPWTTQGATGIGFGDIFMDQSRAADTNGDGLIELYAAQVLQAPFYHVFQWSPADLTLKSTDNFLGPVNLVSGGPAKSLATHFEAIHFGDINGDGSADMFFENTNSGEPYWDILLNNLGGNAGGIFMPPIHAYCAPHSKILDIDGDGRVEIWGAGNKQCTESIWTGLDDNDQPASGKLLGFPYEARKALWADINGDGLQDMIKPGSPGWVRFATGNGYGPKADLINGPAFDGNTTMGMDQGTHIADINHDGLDDLFVFRIDPYPHMAAYLSMGDGSFNEVVLNEWPGEFHVSEGFSTSRIGDFNGDGLVDAVVVSPAGNLNILLQKAGQVDRIKAIQDQYISAQPSEKIIYSPQGSDSQPSVQCAFPQRCLHQAFPVVREHWVWQGEAIGQYRKIFYEYQDARMDMQGQGFLGFAKVIEKDAERLSETITEFDHNTIIDKRYPFAHLPKTITHIAPIFETLPASLPAQIKARITKTVNQNSVHSLNQNPNTFWVPLDSNVREEWEQDVLVSAIKPIELVGNAPVLRHREGYFQYDDFGNTLQVDIQTLGGVHERTIHTFDIREQDWLISLPQSASYVSTQKPFLLWPAPQHQTFEHDAQGLLHKIHIEPFANSSALSHSKTLVRDGDGLVTQIIEEVPGYPARNTFIEYEDHERIFISHLWNDLGFTHIITVHPAFGLPAIVKDMNGIETLYQYDGFGRLLYVKREGEAGIDFWQGVQISKGWVTGLIDYSAGEAGDASFTVRDEWGRPIESASKAFNGQWAVSKTKYDPLGRAIAQSRPDYGKASAHETKYAFDSLDRLLSVEGPDGISTTYEHHFDHLITKSPRNREHRANWDLDGRLIQSIEYLNGQSLTTMYSYGDFHRIEKVTDPQLNETHLQYDKRGRRTLLIDPDQGPKAFVFNGFDELSAELNAQNQWTLFILDPIGRVTDRIDADGTSKYIWDQDLAGTLTKAISPDGTITEFSYDALARPWSAKWTLGANSYAMGYDYDAMGRPSRLDYPEVPGRERFAIEYAYNAQNELEQVRNASTGFAYWTVNARNAEGFLLSAQIGKHFEEARLYEPVTGRLSAIQTLNGAQLFHSLELGYWDDGNLKERNNAVLGRYEHFAYDDLDRLQQWTLNSANGLRDTEYEYDAIGNLTKVFLNGQLSEQNAYGANGKPHALSSNLKGNYIYDNAGRVTSGGGRTISYTAFDLPKTVQNPNGQIWELAYDAFGTRIQKSTDSGNTIRIAEIYERRSHGNSIEHVFSVPGEFGPIAEVHFDEIAQTEKTFFIHADSLGSSSVVTDETGKIEQRLYFEPFGQRIEEDGSPIAANFKASVGAGFTGHNHYDEIGLIDMRGRVYDPAIRRFLTPDPIVSNAFSSQAYNRYSYTYNNPLRFIDPTGFEAEGGPPAACAEKALCPITGTFDLTNLVGGRRLPTKGSGQNKSTAKPKEQQSDDNGSKTPGGAATPTPKADEGKKAEKKVTANMDAWKEDIAAQRAAGVLAGTVTSMIPGGAPLADEAFKKGILPPRTANHQLGMAIGELLGGAVQLFGSWCMFGGGAVVTTTGIGAIIGAPALAASVGLAGAGILNITSGVQNLIGALNSLSSGGGVSQGPAAPKTEMHHTIPREVRAPRSGKPGQLSPTVATHPDVVGRPGLPNRWEIPKELHRSLHPAYNKRFIAELDEIKRLGKEPNASDVLKIRDRLATEFGIDKYRP